MMGAAPGAVSVGWNAALIAVVVLAFVAVFPLGGWLIGRAIAAKDAVGLSAARGMALRLNAVRVQLYLPCGIGLLIASVTAAHIVQGQPVTAGTWALSADGLILGPGLVSVIVVLSRRIRGLRTSFDSSDVPPKPSKRTRLETWVLTGIAVAAAASTELAPDSHRSANSGIRGLAVVLAIGLPLLVLAGLAALIIWRLRGGNIESRRPAVLVAICAFCIIASALTWWIRLS